MNVASANQAEPPRSASSAESLAEFEASVEHHFASNSGVRIHYAATGAGALLVFIHGFPDHWLGWWRQMSDLRGTYRVVAMDLRGYNLSDKPNGAEAYEIGRLVDDVRAVIEHEGAVHATVIGHDWGGFIAWHAAMDAPHLVERLIVLNMPHPWAIARELANNPLQQKASEYVRMFVQPMSHTKIPLNRLIAWVKEFEYQQRHEKAMAASSIEAMVNYYRLNWPPEPYREPNYEPPHVKVPTLLIHGLGDTYALSAGLNDVWQWVDEEVTIFTVPDGGHFVQHDCPDRVTHAIRKWLAD
ncbi:MAG: alpha/beta hydrolase [Sideroxyarcus sp.]|nr:alpha/beta hydrolase [Sideroxyarcus sp.]